MNQNIKVTLKKNSISSNVVRGGSSALPGYKGGFEFTSKLIGTNAINGDWTDNFETNTRWKVESAIWIDTNQPIPFNENLLSDEIPKGTTEDGNAGISKEASRSDHSHPYVEDTSKVSTETFESEIKRVDDRIDSESSRATQAEASLSQKIDAETQRSLQSESSLAQSIQNETQRSIQAESDLSQNIQSETQRSVQAESQLQLNIETETNRSKQAETQLGLDLNSEINRSKQAEQTLQSNINSESNRAKTAEQNLKDALDAEILRSTNLDEAQTQALAAESQRAQTVEDLLAQSIQTESTRAEEAELDLSNRIDAETTLRESEDTILQTNINNEANTRSAADSFLGTQIANETADRKTADLALDGRTTSLEGRATALENRASAIETKNTQQDTSISQSASEIIALKGRVSTAETNINSNTGSIDALARKLDEQGHFLGLFKYPVNLPATATENDFANVVSTHTQWIFTGGLWTDTGLPFATDETLLSDFMPTLPSIARQPGTGTGASREDHAHGPDDNKVDITRTINGKALNTNITLAASDVGALATITFAGTAMAVSGTNASITQAAARLALGLGSAAYAQTSDFATAAQGVLAANAVPNSRTVNGKQLNTNITLTTSDIGAATSAQGATADSAIQSATFAGTTFTKTGTALSITTAQAQAALGLQSAAYAATSDFATSAQGTLATNAVRSITVGTSVLGGRARITVNTGGNSTNIDSVVFGFDGNGILAIAQGGTGSNTASGALTNILAGIASGTPTSLLGLNASGTAITTTIANLIGSTATTFAAGNHTHTAYGDSLYINGTTNIQLRNGTTSLGTALTQSAVRTFLGLGTAAYSASTDFATSAQGTLATNAVRSITAGTAASNGQVRFSVNTGGTSANVDLAVLGLNTAAYVASDTLATALVINGTTNLQLRNSAGTTLGTALTQAAVRTFLGLGSMAYETTTSWVPSTRTINSKALSANITLTADDVGALSTTGVAASTYKLSGQDTRNDNFEPQYYFQFAIGFKSEFKNSSVIGLSGTTYCLLLTNIPWYDASGGLPSQVAYLSNGFIYTRNGTAATTWSSWSRLFTDAGGTVTGQLKQLTNGVDMVVEGTGSSLTPSWQGRIIAGGTTAKFLMGEYRGVAGLGAHNGALNAWESFWINPDGDKAVRFGKRPGTDGWVLGNEILKVDNAAGTVDANGKLTIFINGEKDINYTGSVDQLEIQSKAGSLSAGIAFHKSGNYAVNFGLNSENKLAVGGWSMNSQAGYPVMHEIYHKGNMPTITAMLLTLPNIT